jgi:copper homeostasis protein
MLGQTIIKEACVETLVAAQRAEQLGAHQIELCADLHLDGLTPTKNLIKQTFEMLPIPLKVMIRPRAGNFTYNSEEVNLMIKDIDFCAELGLKNIVTGLLDSHNHIDIENLRKIIDLFPQLSFYFHKAIDLCPNILTEIGILKELPQVRGILSSGQATTAWNGRVRLKQILVECGVQLDLIVAGGVTNKNLSKIHREIGAKYYHGKKIMGNLN